MSLSSSYFMSVNHGTPSVTPSLGTLRAARHGNRLSDFGQLAELPMAEPY